MSPTQPPTADELLQDPIVVQAMEQAWIDSLPNNVANRHEEGGWIYMNTITGQITTLRASAGMRSRISLGNPPIVANAVVVGTFHTHPNPTSSGWTPGPSPTDTNS